MKRQPGIVKDKQRGTWMFRIDGPPKEDGTRTFIKRRGFATMDEATEARDKLLDEMSDGFVPDANSDTVEGFRTAWLKALPAEGLEASTLKHYAEATARLLPTIRAIKLQDLTALDLDAAYAALREAGRSDNTIRKSHVATKKMLTEAKRLGMVARNVADNARPPSTAAARPQRFSTWTMAETLRMLDAIADDVHSTFFVVSAFTGIRVGELVALRWDNVDLDAAQITVSEAVGVGTEGTYAKRTKTKASTRTVELDDELVAVLKAHRKAQVAQRLALGEGWHDLDLVFCEVDGAAIRPNRQSKRWSDLVRRHAKACDVKPIRLHDLRHSHCTQLLDAGVRPDVVSERLGHSSVAFTLQQYGHRYAGDQRSGLARLRSAAR